MGDSSDVDAAESRVRPATAARRVGRFVAMAVAVMVGVGVVLAAIGYELFTSGRWVDESDRYDYEFGGWLFTTVRILLLCVALVILVAAVFVVIRCLRATSGTSHRVSALLLGVLVGVFFRPVPGVVADEALAWASDHSSEHQAAVAEWKEFQAHYRLAPPKLHSGHDPGPASMAPRMLRATDLGKGWYDGMTRTPASMPILSLMADGGATHRVKSLVEKQHWSEVPWPGWRLDDAVSETLLTFGSSSEAKRYAHSIMRIERATSPPNPSGSCRCTVGKVAVGKVAGMAVSSWTYTSHSSVGRSAIFRRGNWLWYVTAFAPMSGRPLSSAELDEVVKVAVSRAAGRG